MHLPNLVVVSNCSFFPLGLSIFGLPLEQYSHSSFRAQMSWYFRFIHWHLIVLYILWHHSNTLNSHSILGCSRFYQLFNCVCEHILNTYFRWWFYMMLSLFHSHFFYVNCFWFLPPLRCMQAWYASHECWICCRLFLLENCSWLNALHAVEIMLLFLGSNSLLSLF